MEPQQDMVERIIRQVLADPGRSDGRDPYLVPVGISNRHIHLSRPDMDTLFGPGSSLRRKKAMKQPGQFAADETVTLIGPRGRLSGVRVLGPLRPETQVEISVADGFVLGVTPPLRLSGRLDGTPGLEIAGPRGSLRIDRGVIAARRHIHMLPATARRLGLSNGQEVDVEVGGERAGILRRVAVRVDEASAFEMHIDVEEANAFCLRNNDLVLIRRS